MTTYSFTSINHPNAAGDTFVEGLNNAGDLVGFYETSFSTRAFRLSGGVYTDLSFIQPDDGRTIGINDAGAIVGSDVTSAEGVLFQNGVYSHFRASGFRPTAAADINNSGQIVGYTFSGGTTHGLLRTGGVDGQFDAPFAAGGPDGGTFGQGINNNGQVVGAYFDFFGFGHGFLLSNASFTMVDNPLGTNGSFATGINDSGHIVGYYRDRDDLAHGFVYKNGIFDAIDLTGAREVFAYDNNNADQVAGSYIDASGNEHGFLATVTAPPPLTLRYVGPGPFPDTGLGELVFTAGGRAVIWAQSGNAFGQVTVAGGLMGSNWSAFGTGFFGGASGGGDILWADGAGGQVAIWQMDGGYLDAFGIPQGRMGPEWHVAALGDFNGDDNTDVLWESTTGQINVWGLKGFTLQAAVQSNGQIGTDWRIVAVGDFYGGGKDSLLWENPAGQLQSWAMNFADVTKVSTVGGMGSEWRVAGVGSFGSDGLSNDVVWVDTGNNVQIWQMTNGVIAQTVVPAGKNGTEWRLTAVADFTDDGFSDLLWLNNAGSADIWQINGSQVSHAFATAPQGNTLVF